jgi:hypothetical protein
MTSLGDLQKWNYVACFIHLAAFIFTLIYLKDDKSKAIVYRNAFDDTTPVLSKVDIPIKLEKTGTTNLKYYTAAFFAVTSLAHLAYATDFFGKGYYSRIQLKNQLSKRAILTISTQKQLRFRLSWNN